MKLRPAGQRRDLDIGAKCGLRVADQKIEDHVVAVPREYLMRLLFDHDDDIACRSTPTPGIPFATERNVVPLAYPRRDRHLDRRLSLHASLAVTGHAWLLDDPPFTVAVVAHGDVHELAEDRSRDLADFAAPFADGAGDRPFRRLRAAPVARLAGLPLLDLDFLVDPGGNFFKREFQTDLQIGTL